MLTNKEINILFDISNCGYLIIDYSGIVVECNDQATYIFKDNLVNKHIDNIFCDNLNRSILRKIKKNKHTQFSNSIIIKDSYKNDIELLIGHSDIKEEHKIIISIQDISNIIKINKEIEDKKQNKYKLFNLFLSLFLGFSAWIAVSLEVKTINFSKDKLLEVEFIARDSSVIEAFFKIIGSTSIAYISLLKLDKNKDKILTSDVEDDDEL